MKYKGLQLDEFLISTNSVIGDDDIIHFHQSHHSAVCKFFNTWKKNLFVISNYPRMYQVMIGSTSIFLKLSDIENQTMRAMSVGLNWYYDGNTFHQVM